MTGPEHYRAAEQLLAQGRGIENWEDPVAAAQVHAILALTAAVSPGDLPGKAATQTPGSADSRQRLALMMDQRRQELCLRWQDVAVQGGISLKALLNVRTGDADIRVLTRRG